MYLPTKKRPIGPVSSYKTKLEVERTLGPGSGLLLNRTIPWFGPLHSLGLLVTVKLMAPTVGYEKTNKKNELLF